MEGTAGKVSPFPDHKCPIQGGGGSPPSRTPARPGRADFHVRPNAANAAAELTAPPRSVTSPRSLLRMRPLASRQSFRRKCAGWEGPPLAFTLIELLVVIAVIAILAGLLLPALAKAKKQAQSVQCLSNVRQMVLATVLYADDNGDQLPFAWWYNASNDDASKNNFQTLIVKYIKSSDFKAGTATTNSDFAESVFRCPTRILENHWRGFKNYPGTGNPWKISYAMNQYTLLSYPPAVTSPKTAKLGSVVLPANTFLIADVSKDLNHPAIIILGKESDGSYDVGYRHGAAYPYGKANISFMDGHINSISAKQTNGIVMDFKR